MAKCGNIAANEGSSEEEKDRFSWKEILDTLRSNRRNSKAASSPSTSTSEEMKRHFFLLLLLRLQLCP